MKESEKVKKIPLFKALWIIGLSACLISGSCLLFIFYYRQVQERQSSDSAYDIVAVVQTSIDAEGLKTAYLTELLGLSIDRPINLFSFNAKKAREMLLRVPFIKNASIAKIRPGTIHVDYVLRKPVAYLADYSNTAIDAEKVLFPLKPFYTPKKLPEIYTGITSLSSVWGTILSGKEIELAFSLLALTPTYCDDLSSLCRIDVSRAFLPSNGEREIVMILEDRMTRVVEGESLICVYPRLLRLSPENYREQLGNYTNLRTYLRKKEYGAIPPEKGIVRQAKALMIDLRISDLAFFVKEP